MSGAYKWLGGLGYIFSIIPLLNIIAPILIGIAWIMMGRDTRNGVFTATGVIMIILIILTAAIFLILPIQFFTLMPFIGAGELPTQSLMQLIQMAGVLIILGIALVVFGLVALILELVSHFRASSIFANKWFKWAAILRIVTIVAVIIAVAALFAMGFMMTGAAQGGIPDPNALLAVTLGPFILVGIIALIAVIFSAVAFFTLPEETPTTHYSSPPPQ